MRIPRPVPALPPAGLLLVGALGAGIAPASAQVTTNPGALDGLGNQAPAAHATGTPAHHAGHAPRHAATRTQGGHAAAQTQAQAKAQAQARAAAHAPAATIPPAPPPPPVFRAPVINVPLHPPPPPPPVVVVPTAVGTVSPIAGGTRISFGAGSADVNPATIQGLHDFAGRMKADPLARADLNAMSGGTPDDPSTPRRLALARGLAARAVLINDGIASTRIYVRVMEVPATGDASAPPDRVDLLLSPIPGSDVTIPAPLPVAKGPAP